MSIRPNIRDPKDVLRDIFDKDKVQLVCEKHNYIAGSERRHTGCQRCIFVDMVALVARTPKDRQKEEFEKLEALVTAMCELEDKGQLQINLNRHPTIHVEHLPDLEDSEDPKCLIN